MRALIGALLMCPMLAMGATNQVEISIDYLIRTHNLGSTNESAWSKCQLQSPKAAAFAKHDLVRRYCQIRHGVGRKHAVFLGVQVIQLLESRKEFSAAEVVEQLSVFPDIEGRANSKRFPTPDRHLVGALS